MSGKLQGCALRVTEKYPQPLYCNDIRTKNARNMEKRRLFHTNSTHEPRLTKIQKNRENYALDSPENHCRQAAFIPFLNHFISQLDQRFLKHKSKIQNILPKQ